MRRSLIHVGEPAPWFTGRTTVSPNFHFSTVAGRYVVLCFLGSASDPSGDQVIQQIVQNRAVFDDQNLCFFGISIDPKDAEENRLQQLVPGIRYFLDFDRQISHQFGVVQEQHYLRVSVVLDERLRVIAVLPFTEQPEQHVEQLLNFLSKLNPVARLNASSPAPILVVPRIFEPSLCQQLIEYYDTRGGEESGFMREIDGKTVGVYDENHKRRRDQEIDDEALRKSCMVRIHDRLGPEIQKAYQFKVTRMERYIVACYDAESKGHFRAHRDNTTKGTAHRRFAVSINLNTGQYEGGRLWFPEFGRQLYQPPAGGALVFSCSLLHEATPVTEGKRYAFLPFLYDDAAAQLRQQNLQFVAGNDPLGSVEGKCPS